MSICYFKLSPLTRRFKVETVIIQTETKMRKWRYTESQIITILKEDENGMKVDGECRQQGKSPATYYK